MWARDQANTSAPRNREIEAAKGRSRAAERYAYA
jgi:hypothetical protein